jgi:VWFA-related protein
MNVSRRFTGFALLAAVAALGTEAAAVSSPAQDTSRFQNGVDLINIAATVTDINGRFVAGLQQNDFTVYEDDKPQAIAEFSTERLPVSLGVALDTSGSMSGSKIDEAREALNRFLAQLLDPGDEIFLYRFSDHPELIAGWTTNRTTLAGALDHIKPDGGTAMYDTVAEAVPLASQGKNRKKGLVLITDGNDTSSNTPLSDVRRLIHESEVLVYAVGIDGNGAPINPGSDRSGSPAAAPPRGGWFPQGRPPAGRRPGFFQQSPAAAWRAAANGDHVNASALHDLTDDSGGRTEIVRDARDLGPATASIADELSKQYDLSYMSSGKKDGRWHAIRVEVRNPYYRVRARHGYFAN